MRVDILGARGSLPAPGPAFARVGGDTSCVAITPDGAREPSLVLDAGTGIRGLQALLGGRPFRGTLALTHLHWDHVMGLPFAAAIDRPDAEVRLLVPSEGADAAGLLDRMLGPPFFPITLSGLQGQVAASELGADTLELDGLRIEARWLPHGRGRALGFRVSDGRSSLAYLPDHGPERDRPGADALALCDAADLLLHDAHFAADEEEPARRAGHATVAEAARVAREADVGRLLLFHHHPERTDGQVEDLAVGLSTRSLPVEAARQEARVTTGTGA